MAAEQNRKGVSSTETGTQNTQYDSIGKKYNNIKTLPSTEPETPSLLAVLGDRGVEGKKCLDLACGTGLYTSILSTLGASSVSAYDISETMITAAQSAYPDPKIRFAVRDCSVPEKMHHDEPFDLVFASWFLNYAGTETELTNMFRVIEQNLAADGRFVGLTTNAHDNEMQLPKMDFYGVDILVLDAAYIAPDSGKEVGIKARVQMRGENSFSFDVFQFRKEVYERCAMEAGLKLKWHGLVLPSDERKDSGFWDRFVERPTFNVLEAKRC